MKKLLLLLAFALCSLGLHAQNLTTISASNITDINGTKLAGGQLCFLITDQQDNPISVSIGGGGQALKRGYCSPVAAGVVTTFTVPNPASTQPAGIYYRVTVKDSSSGLEVLRYTQVSFTGATFNFDNYAPQNLGTPAPLSGNSVTGNLSVTGNVAATGTMTGSNIPGAIPGVGSCTNQFVRALSGAAAPTCNTVGSSDLASSLVLATPNLGAAIASSLQFNGAALGSGATLTVGGTSSTTGGISVFTGAPGSATELAAIYPADGLTGAFRVRSLSIRATSAGFLSGTENAAISNTGAVTAASLNLGSSGTLSTTAQSGTGSLCMTSNCALTSPTLTTPSIGSAGAVFAGSTSGTITVKAAATAGSNTATLPAATGNVVLDSATQTLTNKTLGGTTPVNRVRANQGTPVVVGDWTLSVAGLGSWGSTATITAVSGNDTAGSITILCSGTGQSANPAFKLTFHDGALSAFPIGMVVRGDGNGPAAFPAVFGESTTSITFGFVGGVPVSGISYQFFYWVIGS
jgi:hypothetical protein